MFDHRHVEALPMRRLKWDLWKAGIAIASMLLFLLLMAWIPVSAAGAEVRASGFAAIVTVQATPTEDATVTALNKEKLAQEVQQLKNQNEPDLFGWFQRNASIFLSTLVVVVGALIGFWRWRVDRRDVPDKELEDRKAERERRDEEQKRLLEDRKAERERQSEERFQAVVEGLGSNSIATQVGAAIMLRTFLSSGYEQFYSQTFDLAVAYLRLRNIGLEPEAPDSFNQALIRVFRESFPLARDLPNQSSQSLDALGIRLDGAYLARSDLRGARMPESYLRKANLVAANFDGADLRESNLSRTNLEHTSSLKKAKLFGVKGLTKEQKEACKAKGAITDEDPTPRSSQPTVAPSPSPQSNDARGPSIPPTQGSTPTLDTGESNAP